MSKRTCLEARMQEQMTARPPEMAERLLRSLLPEPVRDNISGDLLEIYSTVISPGCGVCRARIWYWQQAFYSLFLYFRFRRSPQTALESWKGRMYMRRPMHDVIEYHPGISMHHISVGSGVPGLIFVLATIYIFGVGIPAFLELLAFSGTLGLFASRFILNWHKHHELEINALDLHKLNC
jgi:hypothetical protein